MTVKHLRLTTSDRDRHTPAPPAALVVEPRWREATILLHMLRTEGFDVTVTEQFTQAQTFLSAHRPALLVTPLELGDYNGLHLLLHGKAARPEMAAIVLARRRDKVLQAETERLGGTYVLQPVTAADFCAAVWRTLFRGGDPGEPLLPPYERRRRSGAPGAPGGPAASPPGRADDRRTHALQRLQLMADRRVR